MGAGLRGEQEFSLYDHQARSHIGLSLRAPEILFIPNRTIQGAGPTIVSADRTQQIRVGIAASSVAAKGLTERETVSSELRRMLHAPNDLLSLLAGSTPDSTQQPQITDAPDARRLTADGQRPDSGQQIPTVDAWPAAGADSFAARHAAPGLGSRKTPITSGWVAMPLSSATFAARGHAPARSEAQKMFREIATTSVRRTSRSEPQASTRVVDGAIFGGASGAGIDRSFDTASQAIGNRAGSDNQQVLGPLSSRAVIDAAGDSGERPRTNATISPARSDVASLPLIHVLDHLRVGPSLFRWVSARAGFGMPHHFAAVESRQGWLALSQAGGNVRPATSLIRRDTGRSSTPLVIARPTGRTAAAEQQPGVTTLPRASWSAEGSSNGWMAAPTAVKSAESYLQPADLALALTPLRPAAMVAPSLLRRFDAPSMQTQPAEILHPREISHDMPFAAVTTAARGLPAVQHTNGTFLQTAPREAAAAANPLLVGGGAEPRAVETPQASAQPQVDLDEIVEKAWEKLLRKLTIEQERRGYSRWT
jgi:hypothetical protein